MRRWSGRLQVPCFFRCCLGGFSAKKRLVAVTASPVFDIFDFSLFGDQADSHGEITLNALAPDIKSDIVEHAEDNRDD